MVVNVHQAKRHLSRLLDRVAQGEEIVLGKNGHPMARLVPYRPTRAARKPGALSGKIRIAPDFDETPADIIEDFEAAK